MTRRNEVKLAGAIALVIAAAVLFSLPKDEASGQAITSTQLPAATVTAVATSAVTIIPTNSGRRVASICNNTGSANTLFVLPGTTPVVTTANGVAIAAGTCLNPPANLLQSGTVGGGGNSWQGITAGTATAAVIEW
jgi:hypothetical protein